MKAVPIHHRSGNLESRAAMSSSTKETAIKTEQPAAQNTPLEMVGFQLPLYSTAAKLVFLACGLIGSFMVQNFLQEYIFRIPGFSFGSFSALFEFAVCTIGAAGERLQAGESMFAHRRPLKDYLMLTVFASGSGMCGTSALAYVSMPVKVIFKSSKLIPTMISGTVLNGQSYSTWDWASSVMLCICVAMFTLADSSVSLHFSAFGIVLLAAAVVFDSMVPQTQQRLMSVEPAASKAEVIFFSNALGTCLILVTLIVTGEGASAVAFCIQQPSILLMLGVFGCVTYCGVFFYISLVKNFGAVVTVIVTTLRKVFTLCVSFVVFGHQCTAAHVVSGVLAMLLSAQKVQGVDKRSSTQPVQEEQKSQSPV